MKERILEYLAVQKRVGKIKGSILNKQLVQFSLKNIDYIFHLAAVSDINKVKNIPSKTIETKRSTTPHRVVLRVP